MTSVELKREILRALADLVEQVPDDLRFGQLIANLADIARGPTPEAVWDMEDAELLEAARSHLADRSDNVPGNLWAELEAWDRASANALELVELLAREADREMRPGDGPHEIGRL